MKPVLHIIKKSDDKQALEVIEKLAKDNAYGVVAVFIQGAVPRSPIPGVRTCVLMEEAGNPDRSLLNDIPEIESLSYEDLLNLLFTVESITVW